MVQQAICADGGIVSQPVQYFRENEEIYRYIDERLNGTRESYLECERETRIRLLYDSSTYALLTANTPLEQADRAFRIYREHYPDIDRESLAKDFGENGIGFYNNKAKYIVSNLADRELFRDVDHCIVTDKGDHAQTHLMDASGVGPAKSAFSLAMLGFTDHACLDTHVCQYLDIDPREYEKYSADEYKDMVSRAFDQVPELRDEISPFLLQWLLFDLNRGTIETHDLWFKHVVRVI